MGSNALDTEILQTKLYPPRLPKIIARGRLLRELDEAGSTKLTTMVAGAGYGKSTLAAEFLASRRGPSVWYQLEETDRDLSLFITYLVAGLRKRWENIGERTLGCLESLESVELNIPTALTTLISEVEKNVKEELFIVLDDFQEVSESASITEAIDFILRRMPQNLHFIILSRSKLNLDLSSLRAYRELVELGEKDLGFSSEEIDKLFSDVFGFPLRDRDIAALSEMTEGWVSDLVLFYHALKSSEAKQMGRAVDELIIPTAEVSDYLSRVVYENQSEEIREFIKKTSILTRMNPEFCNRFLGINNSREILTYLADGRLFTIPLDDQGNWYRYHHLLRAFIQGVLAESSSPHAIEELNLEAAALWEEYGEPEQALNHYLEAKDYEKAADVLEMINLELVRASRVLFVYKNINLLPRETLEKHPRLAFDLAETIILQGEYEKAAKAYLDAASMFEKEGDTVAQARSLFSAARVLYTSGRPDRAMELIDEVVRIAPEDSTLQYEVNAFQSVILTLKGFPEKGQRLFEKAMEGVYLIDSERTRTGMLFGCGLSAFLRGDYMKAYEILSESRSIAKSAGFTPILPMIYPIMSLIDGLAGRMTESIETAEQGLALSEKLGLDNMVFFNRSTKALALCLSGQREESLNEIAAVVSEVESFEVGIEVLFAEFFAGLVYMLCGMNPEAARHFERAELVARKNGYSDLELLGKVGVAWQSVEDLGLEKARDEIRSIVGSMEKLGAKFGLNWGYPALAFLEWASGDREAALDVLDSGIEIHKEQENVWGWHPYGDVFIPLLAGVFARGDHMDYLAWVFKIVGSGSLPYLRELQDSDDPKVSEKARELVREITREAAEPLMIKMLGPFEVQKGEKRISGEDWKSKKALTVFKYLAAHRERGLIPRDILMELIWPETTPGSAAKNLTVALTSLRKTLEPEAGRGESSYLIVSGDSLRLKLGQGGWIDFELFSGKLKEAEKAEDSGDYDSYLKSLREAESIYRGDFLSEDLYEDWCRVYRKELKEEYLGLLTNISREYLRRDECEESLLYIDKAVTVDPGREELYRSQMKVYSQMGDRAGIERTFERCQEYLKDSFDVSSSPETVELYRKLRGD